MARGELHHDGSEELTAHPVDYRLTYFVLVGGVAAYSLLQSLVIPVLPTIQAGLHTTQASAAWVLTVYLLSASIFTPIIGRLGDTWGKKRMLILALLGLAGGCVISAMAQSITVMIVGRAVQGLGGGLIPVAFSIIREQFPKEKVAGAVGMVAAVGSAGSGLGLVLAGPIVNALSYRWLFWIPMGFLLAATASAVLVVRDHRTLGAARVNLPAALLLSLWLSGLLLAMSEGPAWGWTSSRIVVLLSSALVVGAIWFEVERRSDNPLVDMTTMRVRVVWTSNVVAFLFGMGMYGNFAFLPQFLQTPRSAGYGFGATIIESGLLLLPSCIVMFVAGLSSGRLSMRFGGKNVLLFGAAASVLPFLLLDLARTQKWEIVLEMGLVGVGFGLAYSAMSALIVQGVPADQTGVAAGMNANIRTVGGSIGTAAMASVITSTARRGGAPTDAGYLHGFMLLTLAAAAATVAAVLVPGRLRRPGADEMAEAHMHAEFGLVAGGTLLGDEAG